MKPYDGLANRSLQPLGHLSYSAGVPPVGNAGESMPRPRLRQPGPAEKPDASDRAGGDPVGRSRPNYLRANCPRPTLRMLDISVSAMPTLLASVLFLVL